MKVFKGSSKGDPHVQVVSAIAAFCDEKSQFKLGKNIFSSSTGAPRTDNVAQLPVIVECAQATQLAAKEAVKAVRKRLDPKHASSTVSQYNAIMVLRILVDADSPTILNQIGDDDKLAPVVTDVLKRSRDPSVRELLATTLEHFVFEKPNATELKELNNVYAKYVARGSGSSRRSPSRHEELSQQNLEDIAEEAKSSASLLRQVVSTTAPVEISGSPLVMEFYERCVQLSSKIQSLLSRDSVPPLDESMIMTLISANDTLGTALDAHKAALDRAASLVSPPRHYYEESQEAESDREDKIESSAEAGNTSKEPDRAATKMAEPEVPSQSGVDLPAQNGHTASTEGTTGSSVEAYEGRDITPGDEVGANAHLRLQELVNPFADGEDDDDGLWDEQPSTAGPNPKLHHEETPSSSVGYGTQDNS
ncbi:hypothetical protein V1525DRAFT_393092 [Lipomyces kononenkoae]|uniref:Uncharacterized protein n=1 Tax=Lipomyces kononenkoae TaxID=34357 RepID=A0ACC3TEU5_LIPKO